MDTQRFPTSRGLRHHDCVGLVGKQSAATVFEKGISVLLQPGRGSHCVVWPVGHHIHKLPDVWDQKNAIYLNKIEDFSAESGEDL